MSRYLALFVLLSLSSTGFAAIGISNDLNATNASNIVALPGATVPSIYYSNISSTIDAGGFFQAAGGVNCSAAINPRCRNSADPIRFGFSESTAPSGTGQFVVIVSNTAQPIPSTGTSTLQPITFYGNPILTVPYGAANQVVFTPQISFATLCGKLVAAGVNTIDGNCNPITADAPVLINLAVIADSNGDNQFGTGDEAVQFSFYVQSSILASSSIANMAGVYGFWTYPGDSEVHLHNGAQTDGLEGIQFARFYYVTGPDVYSAFDPNTFSQITPTTNANIAHFDIPVNGSGLSSFYITGLSNGTSYYFRSAVVDNAGNVGYITSAGGAFGPDDTPAGQSPAPFPALHAAKPDQIAGLLEKNGTCFIATATYGTPMAKEVQILREFRDKILMKTSRGQKFIYWYYNNGEYWAQKIKNHDDIRATVRGLLYPVIGFGWLALKIGAYNACLLITTLLLLPLLLIQLKKSRKVLEEIS